MALVAAVVLGLIILGRWIYYFVQDCQVDGEITDCKKARQFLEHKYEGKSLTLDEIYNNAEEIYKLLQDDFKYIFGNEYSNDECYFNFNEPFKKGMNLFKLPVSISDLVLAHRGKVTWDAIFDGYGKNKHFSSGTEGVYFFRQCQRIEYLLQKSHPEDAERLKLWFFPEFEHGDVFKIENHWVKGKLMWKHTWMTEDVNRAFRAWSDDGNSAFIKYMLSLTDMPKDENGNFIGLWF